MDGLSGSSKQTMLTAIEKHVLSTVKAYANCNSVKGYNNSVCTTQHA